MTENDQFRSDLTEEFRRLGENFKHTMQAAWRSEERKRLSREIQTGLNEFGEAVGQVADEFVESPTGQRMKEELNDLAEQFQRGEVAGEIHDKLLQVLRQVNVDLEDALTKWTTPVESSHVDDEG